VYCFTDYGNGTQPSNAAGADETTGSSHQQPRGTLQYIQYLTSLLLATHMIVALG